MSGEKNEENEKYLNMIPEDDRGDVIMVRMILKSVTEFLKEAKEPIEELLKTLGASLDGSKIGQDVAKFYKSLIEAGIPEDMAKQMTTDYFQKRVEAANILSSLTKILGTRRGKYMLSNIEKVIEKEEEEEE
ncbi:MAG: hypothetical protein F7B60_00185 [Desulfurococcales archaeon]|nr:hypothetical protein [Desulfurococcales archaeon]